VITGDVTQIDLRADHASGLVEIQSILHDVPGIEFVYLTERDVVRHHLVREIIRAFDAHEKTAEKTGEKRNNGR
jgi:phosphate starvation-inducible PhoH-like protein